MSKKMPVIIAIVSFVFMGIMGTGLFIMWSKLSSLDRVVNPVAEKESEDVKEEGEKEDMLGPIYALETFIANLADEGGKRYIRVTMNLELKDAVVKEELENQIRQLLEVG